MLDEISAAVLFLVRLIAKSENFKQEQLNDFKACLSEILVERFQNHWFPDQPFKGQAYRCIRVNNHQRREVILEKAAIACGFKYEDLKLPVEFTIWVDPNEVCCRFGEHRGSFCTLASFNDKENDAGLEKLEEKIEEQVDVIVKETKPQVAPLSTHNSHRSSKRRGSGSKNSPRNNNNNNNKQWGPPGQGHMGFPHPLQSWYNLLPQHWAPPSPPPYPHPAAMRSSPGIKWGAPPPPHYRYHWQAQKAALKV